MSKREQVRQFMRWYEGSWKDTGGPEAAYNLTESIWVSEYGKRFYKTYESFRTSRYHYLKYTKNNRSKI